jgi:CBS domain-containing protein
MPSPARAPYAAHADTTQAMALVGFIVAPFHRCLMHVMSMRSPIVQSESGPTEKFMDIGCLCKYPVIAIAADAPVSDAAALMCEHHVGALAVVTNDDPPNVRGVVTDRDLALEVLGRARTARDVKVGDIARTPPIAIGKDASVHEAICSMQAGGVRRLLVVDKAGSVVGLVSFDDLVGAIAEELAGLARTLRAGIAREADERAVISVPAARRIVYPSFGMVASQ